MKNTLKITYYFHDKENDREVTIGNLFVNKQRVYRFTNTPIGPIKDEDVFTLKDLKVLKKDKNHKVILEELDSEYDVLEDVDEADIMYAQGGHGCNSFDEFIERMNFPEEYE